MIPIIPNIVLKFINNNSKHYYHVNNTKIVRLIIPVNDNINESKMTLISLIEYSNL